MQGNNHVRRVSIDNRPKFTVIIPTRERADTLQYCLKTVVAQDYDNLEILVSDNFSSDDTEDLVRSFKDPRIVYKNTGKRVSMSHNWEFALSHIKSGWVTILGDDDGLFPGAVSDLMAIVADNEPVDAITWPSVEYGWPICQNQNLQNTMVIPLVDGVEKRRAVDILSDVINFRRPYNELPFIYKGLVKTEVVKKLRAVSGGTIFHSMIPDIYFSISSCTVIEHYLYSFRPYTVNGASSHSNGVASLSGPEGKEAEQMFLAEEISLHAMLPYCPSIPILVTESLLQAKSCLPRLDKYPVDVDATVKAAIAQLKRAEETVFNTVMSALHFISQGTSLQPETKRALASVSNRPFFAAKRVYGMDIFNKRFIVNCSEFEVKDCFTASILADCFLKLNRKKQLSFRSATKNSVRLVIRELTKRTGWFQ